MTARARKDTNSGSATDKIYIVLEDYLIMKGKKGLSPVITNVLIILLAVVAVVMLWTFIRPLITQGGERVQQTQACLEMQLEPVRCAITDSEVSVTVKRAAGQAELAEIKIVFMKEDGSSEVETVSDVPDELETKIYKISDLESTPVRVHISGGIANEQGNIRYCPESIKVDC